MKGIQVALLVRKLRGGVKAILSKYEQMFFFPVWLSLDTLQKLFRPHFQLSELTKKNQVFAKY